MKKKGNNMKEMKKKKEEKKKKEKMKEKKKTKKKKKKKKKKKVEKPKMETWSPAWASVCLLREQQEDPRRFTRRSLHHTK